MPMQLNNYLKLYRKQIAVSLLIIVYITVNVLRIGGDIFVINLNNTIALLVSIGVTVLAALLWRQMEAASQNRQLWLGLASGWGLWTIAELWWTIAGLLGNEAPFWADFFWLIGYWPLYYGLWMRIRSLPPVASRVQKIGAGILVLIFVGLTLVFVLLPSIQTSDPTTIGDMVSILYPLADIGLLMLVSQLWFSYQQGVYGRAWRWLTAGFVLMPLADLVYAYAVANDLYYPEQQVNLLSTLGMDIPLNLAYVMWIVGLLLSLQLLKHYRFIAKDPQPLTLVPNTHLIVSTKDDDAVIDVSQNYASIYSVAPIKGKTLSEILGLTPAAATFILDTLKTRGVLQEQPFTAITRFGQMDVLISGTVIRYTEQDYSGSILLVRLLVEDYTLDDLLTDYEKSIVRSQLRQTHTEPQEQAEIKRLLVDYYRALFNALYNLAFTEGGSIMADAFISEVQATAHKEKLPVHIQPDALDVRQLSLPETQRLLPQLLETAQQFVIKLKGEATATATVQAIRSKFGNAALQNVAHFEREKES